VNGAAVNAGRRALVAVAATALWATTSCGVPTDSDAVRIAAEDVPFGLVDTAASSVPSTNDVAPDVDVELFYVSGEELVAVAGRAPSPLTPSGMVGSLLSTTAPGSSVRSVLEPDDIVSVAVDDGTVVIDLDQTLLELPTNEQVLAVGQLVLTLTGLDGVTSVAFVSGGEPVAVPLPDGTAASDPVGRESFRTLLG
jgi:hypothetical protein